jgi:hypothetical protein
MLRRGRTRTKTGTRTRRDGMRSDSILMLRGISDEKLLVIQDAVVSMVLCMVVYAGSAVFLFSFYY